MTAETIDQLCTFITIIYCFVWHIKLNWHLWRRYSCTESVFLQNTFSLSSSLHIFLMLSFRKLRFVISSSCNLCLMIAQMYSNGTMGQWHGDTIKMIESILRRLVAVITKGVQVSKEDFQNKVCFRWNLNQSSSHT